MAVVESAKKAGERARGKYAKRQQLSLSIPSLYQTRAARPPHLAVPFIITSMELPCCPYLNDDLAANGREAASEDSFCGEIFSPLTTKGRGDRERGA